MPYKLKDAVRHKFEKRKYHLSNWGEYNKSLKNRGSLTIWFSEEAIACWNYQSEIKKRGGQQVYSDLAIMTCMTLKLVYKLPFRQTEGFVTSVVRLLGAELDIPDYTTVSKRSAPLKVPKVLPVNTAEDVVIIIDSTGLKVYGEKEWCNHKHGGQMQRRVWRKLHIGVDPAGFIHCSELTTLHESDDSQVEPLLDGVTTAISRIIGDGGYHANPIHDYCLEHYPENIPEIIIPPNKTIGVSSAESPTTQDLHIVAIKEKGRQRWQKDTGYNNRVRVENTIYRYKTIIGRKMSARKTENQITESKVAVFILNTMTALGMPIAHKVA